MLYNGMVLHEIFLILYNRVVLHETFTMLYNGVVLRWNTPLDAQLNACISTKQPNLELIKRTPSTCFPPQPWVPVLSEGEGSTLAVGSQHVTELNI